MSITQVIAFLVAMVMFAGMLSTLCACIRHEVELDYRIKNNIFDDDEEID